MKRPEAITSVHNPRVKLWASLLERKGRERQQAYIVEGVHLVQEALHWGAEVESVLFSAERGLPEQVAAVLPADIECVSVSEQVLAKCSDAQSPQPVAAVIRKTEPSADRLLDAKNSLVVVCDGIQDPGNLGAIIRSADAAGADGVVLGKGTVDLYNPKTIRSTMGSLFHIPVVSADLPALFAQAKAKGIRLVVTSLQATRTCFESDFTGPTWLVLGNEGQGVSPEAASLVDEHVIIPMPGRAESLNVAMAATVLLFEAVRQRAVSANKNS